VWTPFFDRLRPTGGEDPDDLAAVARVAHFRGKHRVDPAREAGVPFAATALAGRLVGLVDEDEDLPQSVQDVEDLLEVSLRGADSLNDHELRSVGIPPSITPRT
jgi:hypothetical protein